jgi:hypothetical protein
MITGAHLNWADPGSFSVSAKALVSDTFSTGVNSRLSVAASNSGAGPAVLQPQSRRSTGEMYVQVLPFIGAPQIGKAIKDQ